MAPLKLLLSSKYKDINNDTAASEHMCLSLLFMKFPQKNEDIYF